MDNLFEQMANITKAHGYDILSKQVAVLKSERDALEAKVKQLKDTLQFAAEVIESQDVFEFETNGLTIEKDEVMTVLNKALK